MILRLSPDTPVLIRAAAASVLILHIGAGGAGLLSGAAAFAVRKGGRLHRLAGGVFIVSMLIMSAIGAAVSPFLPQKPNVVPRLFTFYLVATGWMAARRRDDHGRPFEIAGMLFALAIVATGVNFGLMAAHSPTGRLDGDAPSDYYTFAALPALACALDLHVILRRRLASAQRMAPTSGAWAWPCSSQRCHSSSGSPRSSRRGYAAPRSCSCRRRRCSH